MGCAVSCVNQATMSLFGKSNNVNDDNTDGRTLLERKLYIAKESPEPDFDLSDCQLRHIPSGTYSICKVYRKDHLYLHNNSLHSLEEGGQLSDLYLIKVLNLSSNRFTQLPNDIRFLVNLTELYLQNNHIKQLPDNIQFLQSLQILDVSNNKLRNLSLSLGKLNFLRKLNLTNNPDLTELCPELCFASSLTLLEISGENFTFPPQEVAIQSTMEIMKYLCNKMNVEYEPPASTNSNSEVQSPNSVIDPFARHKTFTWEEQEAAIIEQENRLHRAAKEQREKFLNTVLQEQIELDNEIAKVHMVKEIDRQRLIKAIQDDEQEIECLVKNFIQSDNLLPEVKQQQLAYEQTEHDRLLEIVRQNYDNVKKADILRAMETLIEEDYVIKHSKKHYDDSLNNIKQSIILQDIHVSEKVADLLNAKDQSRSELVEQLLEDQSVQMAMVGSLIEKVDAKSWSLNQEISLISSHLARLSVIEQEKKRLQITYNNNELLQQRIHLITLLDDLFEQRSKRKKQLVQTLKEMEQSESNKSNDFWLKNYQKLVESAPKDLLNIGKCLDPALANYLLQEGVIHCLPFLVKFLFSGEPLLNITMDQLKSNGVCLSADREAIIRAVNSYVGSKSKNHNFEASLSIEASAPTELVEEQICTGVVTTSDTTDLVTEAECVICMDAKSEVVFVPCGHMCCCYPCSEKEMDGCPMCRSSIERKIKVIIA